MHTDEHCSHTSRQIRFLRIIQHENVVNIRSVFCSGTSRTRMGDLYVVTEVMDTDLCTVTESARAHSFSSVRRYRCSMFNIWQYTFGWLYLCI